jgi:hypothetical protein
MSSRAVQWALLLAAITACKRGGESRTPRPSSDGRELAATGPTSDTAEVQTRALLYASEVKGQPHVALLIQGLEFTLRQCNPEQPLPDVSSPIAVRHYVEWDCPNPVSERVPDLDPNNYWVVKKFHVRATQRFVIGTAGAMPAGDRTGVTSHAWSVSLADPTILLSGGSTMRTDMGEFNPHLSKQRFPLHGEAIITWKKLGKETIEIPLP